MIPTPTPEASGEPCRERVYRMVSAPCCLPAGHTEAHTSVLAASLPPAQGEDVAALSELVTRWMAVATARAAVTIKGREAFRRCAETLAAALDARPSPPQREQGITPETLIAVDPQPDAETDAFLAAIASDRVPPPQGAPACNCRCHPGGIEAGEGCDCACCDHQNVRIIPNAIERHEARRAVRVPGPRVLLQGAPEASVEALTKLAQEIVSYLDENYDSRSPKRIQQDVAWVLAALQRVRETEAKP